MRQRKNKNMFNFVCSIVKKKTVRFLKKIKLKIKTYKKKKKITKNIYNSIQPIYIYIYRCMYYHYHLHEHYIY